jgi:hypothetical protein
MKMLFRAMFVVSALSLPFGAYARSTSTVAEKSRSCVANADAGIAEQVIDSVSGLVSGTASYALTATGYLVDVAAYILVPAVAGSLLCALPAVELARVEEDNWSTGQVSGFGGLVCVQELVKWMDPEKYVPRLGAKAFHSTANWRCHLLN